MHPHRVGTASYAHTLLLTVVPLLAMASAPLDGQVVRGTVTEADGNAVEGAIVRLIASDSKHVAILLTDREGRFVAVAPREGIYTLEIEHVAFVTTRTDPFTIPASGGTTRTVALTRRTNDRPNQPRTGRREDEPDASQASLMRAKRA
jgi:hypothetical protein